MRVCRSLATIALALAAACVVFRPADETAIRKLLEALSTEANSKAGDELGSITRAAQIGAFFSEDAVIDLGAGTGQIVGRNTVVGMARRLESRTAAFTLSLQDVCVDVAADGLTADVTLTAEFARHPVEEGEHSLDAREFAATLRKVDGEWYIARLTAVDTLKK